MIHRLFIVDVFEKIQFFLFKDVKIFFRRGAKVLEAINEKVNNLYLFYWIEFFFNSLVVG
jgi:hypothetical protein